MLMSFSGGFSDWYNNFFCLIGLINSQNCDVIKILSLTKDLYWCFKTLLKLRWKNLRQQTFAALRANGRKRENMEAIRSSKYAKLSAGEIIDRLFGQVLRYVRNTILIDGNVWGVRTVCWTEIWVWEKKYIDYFRVYVVKVGDELVNTGNLWRRSREYKT